MKIAMKNEREIILGDPVISRALGAEAESVGVSLEEYIDRFLEVFYSEPQKLYSLIKRNI